MSLGLKEGLIALSVLCNHQPLTEMNQNIPATKTTSTTAEFPMKRGNELLKITEDGTFIERLKERGIYIIYVINQNRKIKIENPSKEQEKQLLSLENFEEIKELCIQLMTEMQNQSDPKSAFLVMFEEPIDECQFVRYRRLMYKNPEREVFGGIQCIWDEVQTKCKQLCLGPDCSFKEFETRADEDGIFCIPDNFDAPDKLPKGDAPSPREWLGNQPDCPESDSVILNF